jgi:hypothetical protein
VTSDERTWRRVPAHAVGSRGTAATAPIAEPGAYLDGTELPQLAAPAGRSSRRAVWIGVGVAAVAVALVLVGVEIARSRRRRA